MKTLRLSILTLSLCAWSFASIDAQEKIEILPKKANGDVEALPLLDTPDSCHPHRPGINVLPVIQAKPICVLTPREVITTVKRPTQVIAYRDEVRLITDTVMKETEVLRKVPCTEMVPCKVTDPHTGHCSTILKPVTTYKIEKDIVFRAVPVTRKETVKVPYLKNVTEEVLQRNILLEYKTEYEPRTYAVGVPHTVLPDRYWLAPPKCTCPTGTCPLHAH